MSNPKSNDEIVKEFGLIFFIYLLVWYWITFNNCWFNINYIDFTNKK